MSDEPFAVLASTPTFVDHTRRSPPDIGALVDEAPDTMALHTREAYRLFVGRTFDPGRQIQAIVGGRRVAAALRAIWYLSGNDNPYRGLGAGQHR